MSSASQTSAERARAYWNEASARKAALDQATWTSIPRVHARIHRLISGGNLMDGYGYALSVLRDRGVQFPLGRLASFGCGVGELERGLVQYGVAREFFGFDLSEQSIALATRAVAERREPTFVYQRMDLNAPRLPQAFFDIAFGVMSLHHIEQLEAFAQGVFDSLKPGAYFIVHEYIGPNRFQWTDAQMELGDRVLKTLPERLRRMPDGALKTAVERPTVEWMIATDPSEAPRATDILPCLKLFFDIVETRPYGGALLHPLLAGIAHHFVDEADTEARAHLDLMFALEDMATRAGALADDFCFYILRRKD